MMATHSNPSNGNSHEGATLADKQHRSEYKGRLIIQVAKQNPRHPGTHGHHSFDVVVKAGGKIRYEEYKAQGGRPQDLKWDLDHGYVKLGPPRGKRTTH